MFIETLTEITAIGPPMSEPSAESEAVDPETVEHVAGLARIDLDEAERERFAEQFSAILEAFASLDEVPAVEREPPLTNVMRPDAVDDCLSHEEALENAAETEDGFFKGPRVS